MATYDVSKQGTFEPIKGVKIVADYAYSYISGTKTSVTLGDYNNIKFGAYLGLTTGLKFDVSLASKWSVDVLINKWSFDRIYMGENATEVTTAKKELAVAKAELAAESMEIVEAKLASIADNIELVDTNIKKTMLGVFSNACMISDNTLKVDETAQEIKNIDTKVEIVASVVGVVGAAVIEHEAKIESNTTHIQNNEMAIIESGILILD